MSKVVFVLGAGASVEFGLPTGKTLCDDIIAQSSALDNDSNDRLKSALINLTSGITWEEIRRVTKIIVNGLPFADSIDTFLHRHRSDELLVRLGKLSIATAIADKEALSPLRKINADTARNFSNSWLGQLLALLHHDIDRGSVSAIYADVAFINFNYDRCVETFFYAALPALYPLDLDQQSKISNSVKIIHPYGTLGDLPWQGGNECLRFGDKHFDLTIAADRIRTLTEGVTNLDHQQEARELVARAKLVVFLGFGFHSQNIEYLSGGGATDTPAWLTTLGMTALDSDAARNSVEQMLHGPSRAVNATCAEFLSEHSGEMRRLLRR